MRLGFGLTLGRSTPVKGGGEVSYAHPYLYDMFDGPGADYRVPANIRAGLSSSTYASGGYLVEQQYPVTGSQGAMILTCSNSALVAGMGSAPWSGAILLADGVTAIEVLIMSSDGTSTLNLAYPLPVAVPEGSILTSLYDVALGQHRTKVGTLAWTQKAFGRNARYTRRLNSPTGINRQTNPNPIGAPKWIKNAVLAAWVGTVNGVNGFAATDEPRNIINGGTPLRPVRPASHACGTYAGMPSVGCGLVTSGALPAGGGFVELYPEIVPGTAEDIGSAGEVSIWFTDKAGVERLAATTPFGRVISKTQAVFAADDVSYRIEAKRVDNGLAWWLRLLELRIFASARSGPVIPAGAKVTLMCDSWGAWYDGLAATELQRLLPGRTIVNHSLGGMTMAWVLAWLDHYITLDGATDIVINQAINDLNPQAGTFLKPDGTSAPLSMGATTEERTANWIAAIGQAAAICQARGVRLHLIMPSGTASNSQAQGLVNAASSLYSLVA